MRVKRELMLESILEFAQMEKHFEKMAAEGWRLKKIGTFLTTYEEAEPRDVHYSVVFFPKADFLAPEPSDNLIMMREFCEKAGWKLVCEVGQMQVFCNEARNPVPIETEAWIQVENIHKTAKKNLVLIYSILFANAILQLLLQLLTFSFEPLDWIVQGHNIYLSMCWIAFAIGCSVEIIYYYRWYHKAKRIADEKGIMYLPKSIKCFRLLYLSVAMISLTLSIIALGDYTTKGLVAIMVIWTAIIVAVPIYTARFLKKCKLDVVWNRIITVIVCLACVIGMIFVIFYYVDQNIDAILKRDEEMTLHLSQFHEIKEENLRSNIHKRGSVFISMEEGYQMERVEQNGTVIIGSTMEYTLIDVKTPFLYNFVKNELLKCNEFLVADSEESDDPSGYRMIDNSLWGACEVYQYFMPMSENELEEVEDYIICYEDKLLQIDVDWDVSDEDIKKIREVLHK